MTLIHEPLTVVLLFGGRSSEHSISCATAAGVLGAIDRSRYRVLPVGITPEGAFVLVGEEAVQYDLSAAVLPTVRDNGRRVNWPTSTVSRELTVTEPDGSVNSLGHVDLVFPILHGPFGEDGTIQGMLELINLPYVGAGVLASALGMDKHFTKSVLLQAGLPVAPWELVRGEDWRADPAAVRERMRRLGSPLFVKPARAGSSIGVSRVGEPSELADAMVAALAQDDKVLVESAIAGREIELAVLGGRPGEAPRVSVAGEIVVTGRDFYDFDAKYRNAMGVDLVCPAPLTAEQLADLQDLAVRAFAALDGAGLARVDFFLTDGGAVINEVNTMPGFTPISMFPKCWLASGLSYPQLIDELLQVALAHRG